MKVHRQLKVRSSTQCHIGYWLWNQYVCSLATAYQLARTQQSIDAKVQGVFGRRGR